jgi:hypothetical protein
LRAATDTEIETSTSALTLTKQRDGELGFQIGFELVDLIIGEDPNGLCIKSAVVEWNIGMAPAPATATKGKEAPRSLRMLISVVRHAIMESESSPIRPFADGPLIKAVSDEIVRRRYYLRIAEKAEPDEDPKKLADRQRNAFNNAVKSALKSEDLMARDRDGVRYLWIGKER